MDQDLAWWAEVVFGGWRDRSGPGYQQLATALLEAVDRRLLREGTRVPAERTLAAAVGVSRGTVVACYCHLTAAGVLRRRQGSGTYVLGRPSWADQRPPAVHRGHRRRGPGHDDRRPDAGRPHPRRRTAIPAAGTATAAGGAGSARTAPRSRSGATT